MLGGTTLTRVEKWYDYVRRWAGDDSSLTIAAKIRKAPSTVSRWQGRDPAARDVIAFAKVYGRPIPEALIAAFGLTPKDLQVPIVMDPHAMSNDELASRAVQMVEELGRRLTEAGGDDTPPWSDARTREHERERAERK